MVEPAPANRELAPDPVRLSEAISRPLISAYKEGRLGLAFLVSGALLMLFSSIVDRPVSYVPAVAGFLLIVVPCYFFWAKEIQPLRKIEKKVEEDSDLVDAVQDIAVSLTELVLDLQALAFKHSDSTRKVIAAIRPALEGNPILGRLVDSMALDASDDSSRTVVEAVEGTRTIIEQVKAALVSSNPKKLHKYVKDLEQHKKYVREILASK